MPLKYAVRKGQCPVCIRARLKNSWLVFDRRGECVSCQPSWKFAMHIACQRAESTVDA